MGAAVRLLLVAALLVPSCRAAAAAAPKFAHHPGALSAGGDLGAPQNLSTAAAIAYCASLDECAGFTFSCSDGATDCPAASAAPVKTYFKSGTAGSSDATWWTYVKEQPHLLAESFGSHMVLQHEVPCLWGFGKAGTAVTISLNGTVVQSASTTVAANGTWQSCLPPQPASHAPATVGINVGADSQELSDVLFGEVWVASGQSNMAFAVTQAFNHSAECAAAASFPSLRLFTVAVNFDWQKFHKGEPRDFNQSGVRQQWSVSSHDSVCAGGDFDHFSAVGFFFCRELQEKLGVPVGCVATSVPGTNIELWSSATALAQCPEASGAKPAPNWSALWQAMVAPLTRMSVKGFIWYQGEANVGQETYGCRFKAMITDWRRRFSADGRSQPLAPFLFVQLAGWHGDKSHGFGGTPCMIEGGDGAGQAEHHGPPGSPSPPTFGGAVPQQRLVQLDAFQLPQVGMACTVDLGDAAGPFWPGSIHPRQKQPVGHRLALEARRIAYGEPALLSRGPQIQRLELLPGDTPYGSYHSKAVRHLFHKQNSVNISVFRCILLGTSR
jgi:sialate O-acetylesterase